MTLEEKFQTIQDNLPPKSKIEYCYLAIKPWLRDKNHLYTFHLAWKVPDKRFKYRITWITVFGATANEAADAMLQNLEKRMS